MYGNNRGIIVEDTVASADIRVSSNYSHHNDLPPGEGSAAGIFVHNADRLDQGTGNCGAQKSFPTAPC